MDCAWVMNRARDRSNSDSAVSPNGPRRVDNQRVFQTDVRPVEDFLETRA